jgi:hypothetical protein
MHQQAMNLALKLAVNLVEHIEAQEMFADDDFVAVL